MHIYSYFPAPITNIVPTATFTLEDTYNYIKGPCAKERTEVLRRLDGEKQKEFKRTMFDSVTFSGTFSSRNAKNLIEHSGLLCIDIDDLSNEEVINLKQRIINDTLLKPVLIFRSPRGLGLKVVISFKSDSLTAQVTKEEHKHAYDFLELYFKDKYSIAIDPHCKDVGRACFLPFDPDAYISQDLSNCDLISISNSIKSFEHGGKSEEEKCEYIIERIEESQIDITQTYDVWLRIGFALASEFAEKGRSYFHRISKFYMGPEHSYTPKETDIQYTKCIQSKGQGITIASFYAQAKKYGFEIKNAKNIIANGANGANGESEYDTLPTFSDKIRKLLPNILQKAIGFISNTVNADIVLLAALSTVSACFPKLFGYYSRHRYGANIFVILEGPASAGKGYASYGRYFGEEIHKEMVERYNEAMIEYNKEVREWKENGEKGEVPKIPKRILFFVPADSTSSAFIRALERNNGRALIFESEIDTMTNSFNSRFGNYSTIFRKSFHHETIENSRSTDDRYIRIEHPMISACLSGTPEQVGRLIPSVENGLASRFIFYNIPVTNEWNDPFEGNDNPIDIYMSAISTEFHSIYYDTYKDKEVEFRFLRGQEDRFNQAFKMEKNDAFNEYKEIIPTIHRLGLICFRIAMILSMLNNIEKKTVSPLIYCDDASFDAAMNICECILEHDRYSISMLPKSTSSSTFATRKMDTLYEHLPSSFDREKYREVARSLNINDRTVDRYIHKLLEFNKIQRNDTNNYIKIK